LVDQLTAVSRRYHQQGEAFFASAGPARNELYFGRPDQPGLYASFREIKTLSQEILRLNEGQRPAISHRSPSMPTSSSMPCRICWTTP
jgi:hypothetical protein